MNAKLRRKAKARKRRMLRRIDKNNWSGASPMIRPASIQYEIAEKQQAIAAGGIGTLLELAKQLELRKEINRAIPLFKLHLPYDEADHVFNIAMNLLAGGHCLEHIEDRRCDEAYLNAVGAERIPDPTTAGDFCRRFETSHVLQLLTAFNRVREKVWKRQPDEFFDVAIIEADGTQVETSAEKKQGIGINYKGQWGYHPLIVTLANTREPLYIANRSGNRPSHENSAFYFDLAVERCRSAGFRKIVLRGDTDFALTENFDRWDDDDVEFVFGIDAMPNLVEIAENLDESAWKTMRRRRSLKPPAAKPRAKRSREKEAIVVKNKYLNKKLASERIAEFEYRPGKCDRTYRVVVLHKEVHLKRGQMRLFEKEEPVYFFYITNATKSSKPTRQVVVDANARCNQENNIAQLKQCALSAPLHDLTSNWAYMVIASLAWNLKIWSGLMITPSGVTKQKDEELAIRNKLIGMDFTTFRDRVLMVPAQIIRRSRQLVYRLLSYRPSVDWLLLIDRDVRRPLRC
ncbi:MAG: IS1380 family transposase [Rubripirellula sp.]